MSTPRSRRKLLMVALPLLSLFSLAMCFVSTELLARLLFARPTLNLGLEMWKYAKDVKQRSPDPEVGHRHKPNAHAVLMSVDVKTNSMGLRDVERSQKKPPNTYRIVVLGDSITFGWGVPFESTYCQVLERLLNAHPPIQGKHFEVINTGVGNLNTSMEVTWFLQEGYKLEPDFVLVGWFINDAEPTPIPTESWLAYHSYAYAWIHTLVDEVGRNNSKKQGYQEYYRGLYGATEPGWLKCQKALENLARYCHEHKLPCQVLLIPELHTLGAKYEFQDVYSQVRAVCEKLGLPVLDLLDAFPAEGDPKQFWVCPADAHPNGKGEELMGQRIDRALREEQWIK